MRLFTISSAIALSASASNYAFAFSDTSPFLFLSTAEIPQSPIQDQLQTSSRVSNLTKNLLLSCPTPRYLVVSQSNVNAADLSTANGCGAPNLCQAMTRPEVRTKTTVSEVLGFLPIEDVTGHIKQSCGDEVDVKEIVLPILPSGDQRSQTLLDNDRLLRESLDSITSTESYTIIYFSGPAEATYEADFQKPLNMDLKRQVQPSSFVRRDDEPDVSNHLNLFEKYQFFTPGIFMGLLIGLFLISILSVGIKALGSLEVSYGAFDKDMGPGAQKKQH